MYRRRLILSRPSAEFEFEFELLLRVEEDELVRKEGGEDRKLRECESECGHHSSVKMSRTLQHHWISEGSSKSVNSN